MSPDNQEKTIYDENQKENQTKTSQCPSCGATMVYYPPEKCLICEHCHTKKKIDLDSYSEEIDFANFFATNSNTWGKETHVFKCNNCGAKQVLDKNDISLSCPFCGTTNVVETDELSGLKPNAIVPFEIDGENAKGRLKVWAKKRFFAPRSFKKSIKVEGMKGIYSPAFTYDCDTTSTYSARLGKYYYKTKRVNGKNVQVKEIRYFNVSGTFNRAFDDILIQASNNISQTHLVELQPFDTNTSQAYSTEFLHGFGANQYAKDGLKCWGEARQVIDRQVKSAILAQYDHDTVEYININTLCDNIKFKYILLPIYVGHFSFKQKLYNFFVNGKNGRVTGKTPISPLRVTLVTLVGLAVAAGIVWLVMQFI